MVSSVWGWGWPVGSLIEGGGWWVVCMGCWDVGSGWGCEEGEGHRKCMNLCGVRCSCLVGDGV